MRVLISRSRCRRAYRPSVRHRLVTLGVAAYLAAAATGSGQVSSPRSDSDRRLIAALEDYVPHVMRRHQTPGLNLALARGGRVIWERGFGYADWEARLPMTPETVMHSGSMGKTYTATAVMQLVERGHLGLRDPIRKYLPDFDVRNPHGDRDVTVHDLLTHRSGLASNAAGSDFVAPPPLRDHLRDGYRTAYFKSYEASVIPRWGAKVGERFQYSNFGLATLGYLVEVANPERLSFSEYVQRHIIDPLGMQSTQYPPVQDAHHVRPEVFRRFSKGYAHLGAVHLATPTIYFADYPAGTVVTTPGDHIRLLLAYLNGGRLDDYQLLRPETVKEMLTPQYDGGSDQVGLIWLLRNVGKPDFSFGHGGAHMYGWTNDFRAYPEQDFALAVATNHWPMVFERYREHRAIAEFISRWIALEQAGQRPSTKSWGWKTSYVMGLIMIENLRGGLGIGSPVTSGMVEAMARGATVQVIDRYGDRVWDAEGFRAGVNDMLTVRMTPADLRAFLDSDHIRVTAAELQLIHRELGGTGTAFPAALSSGR